MRRAAVLTVCILVFFVSFAWADFYRYVDKDGNEFFTNDLKQVPAEYRDRAREVNTEERRVNVGKKPAATRAAPGIVQEHRDKYGKGEIYWHRKAENLRLKLRDQQDEYDHVLEDIQKQERNPARKGKKSGSALEKKKRKLEREIAKTRRMIDVDLPEAARKADAYPGWLRE
jgi:Domain of unknown function (DUF4124)